METIIAVDYPFYEPCPWCGEAVRLEATITDKPTRIQTVCPACDRYVGLECRLYVTVHKIYTAEATSE